MMKSAGIAVLLFVCFQTSSVAGGLCSMTPPFWICQDRVATLDGQKVKEIVIIPGFLDRNIIATFEANENIEKISIRTDTELTVSELSGPTVTKIKISGKNKKIPSLCPLLDTRMKLPNLLKVEIDQAEVLNFRGNQDCGTNDLRVPLIPFNETGNFVRVRIENSKIFVDSPDGFLILDRLYNLKSLHMRNVTIHGVRNILLFRNAAIENKFRAEKIFFADHSNCECNSVPGSKDLKCDESDACRIHKDGPGTNDKPEVPAEPESAGVQITPGSLNMAMSPLLLMLAKNF